MIPAAPRRAAAATVAAQRQKAVQVAQHRRRGAPDEVARAAGPRASTPCQGIDRNWRRTPPQLERVALVVGRRHQELQRHLERLGHLEAVELQREAAAAPAPTTGVTTIAGDGGVGAAAGRCTSTRARARRPTSSSASRSAVATASASCGSARPPGKLIWPAWSRRWSVRCVSSTCRPSGACTSGTSTDGCGRARGRSEARRRRGSRAASRAAAAKRWRSAAGVSRSPGDRRQVVVDADHRNGLRVEDAGIDAEPVADGSWRASDASRPRAGLVRQALASRSWRTVRRARLARCSGQLFLDARRLAGALAQVVQLGAAHVAAALDFDRRRSAGCRVWNVRSTPSPLEILRTMKLQFRPRLRLAITTPS